MGDRGYGKRDNVIALAGMQAAALLRFSPNHCRLEQADGSLFEVSRWLDRLEEAVQIGEQDGYCVQGRERVKVRVLALRLPPEEAEKARQRVLARARRKQQVVRPETLQLAGWILLLSTLDAHDFSAEELFWLYRNRWQIELLIKQMKQFLLQEEEGQALLRTLMNTAEPGQQSLVQAYVPLLEEWEAEDTTEETVGKNAEEEEDELRRPVSRWLVTACCLSRWRVLVLGQWSAARVQLCLPRLRRFLCPSPRRRVHQRLWFLAWVQQRFLGTPLLGTFP